MIGFDLQASIRALIQPGIESAEIAGGDGIKHDGAMIDPRRGKADPALTDRDVFLASVAGGHGRRGAAIGGEGDQPDLFRADMLSFFARLHD